MWEQEVPSAEECEGMLREAAAVSSSSIKLPASASRAVKISKELKAPRKKDEDSN